MKPDIYRQLQRHLDRMPVPFPETSSGVEIRMLKQLFNEEEAGIALKLSAIPEPVDKIHKRFKKGEITRELLASRLKGLFDKGAIMSFPNPKKGRMYSKLPLAIGIFEHQVDRITKEFAEDFYKYEDEGFADALLKNKTKQMRTIPVNVKLDPEFIVGSYDSARNIIEQSPGPFAVMNCICRQAKEKMGESCKQSDVMDTCFTLGASARFMMAKGVAKKITKDKIMDLLNRAERAGMVLQPENTREPGFICCCCGCCCGVLTAAKKYENPSGLIQTNFYAEINTEKCAGCGECIMICQMDALVSVNSHTEVLLKRCIGCGNCLNVCVSEAIALKKTEREVIPPKDRSEMYKKMIVERYGVLGALKFMGKAALGKKI